MSWQIFWAFDNESVPPNTVKSWANTATGRPRTWPNPHTTPSPTIFLSARPKSEV